jgi:two-component system, NtrC family, nitrogen regulation sensor histidine kinase NtrY
MISNKKIYILILMIFIFYSVVLIFYFNSKINYSFDIFQIQKQREIINLSLSYNKKLFQISSEDEKKTLLKEYNFITKQQEYTALLDYYKIKIISGIFISTVILSLIILTVLLLIVFIFLRQFLYPLQQVIFSLNNYIKHNKVNKVVIKGSSEIKSFLYSFNDLMNKLVLNRVEDKIRSSFQNWQTLARIIVHEIKNQISPVNLNIESLIYYNEEIHMKKGLENIRINLDAIEKIVNNFKNLSNLPEPTCSNININELLISSLTRLNLPEFTYTIVNENENFEVYTDKFYLELILINILKNAAESKIIDDLKIEIIYQKEKNKKILIKDNGCGIPEDIIPKIYKPGFTTKEKGDGIGLFLVKELCNCLDIKIKVDSIINSGTTIILEFNDE